MLALRVSVAQIFARNLPLLIENLYLYCGWLSRIETAVRSSPQTLDLEHIGEKVGDLYLQRKNPSAIEMVLLERAPEETMGKLEIRG